MSAKTILDKSFVPYISEEEIDKAVQKVAAMINADYSTKSPLIVSVLNGSFMFTSDLMKKITVECHLSFIKLASYEGTSTTGTVNELIGLNESVEGRDLILIEDIVDTGNTLEKLYQILETQKPKSIKIATLLYKPAAYKKAYKIDYVGLEIPNAFVVGFGLDYDGLGRNLSSIYVLND